MNYFITAGEPSGDIYGGLLMHEIKKVDSEAQFYGFGGKQMESEGLVSLAPIESLSVMGLVEVAKHYRFFKKLQKQCKQEMKTRDINVYIPIDYPGFNIPLASFARSINIPVAYYIVPQLWAWGKNRAKKLINCVDKLLPIFPFEVDFYKQYGMQAETPGHPLLDLEIFSQKVLTLDERKNQIAVMAGSRMQELDKHLPILKKAIEIIHREKPEMEFATATVSEKAAQRVMDIFPKDSKVTVYEQAREMMRESKYGIIKSGTSNLEAALLGLPFCMVYKLSNLTYHIGKHVVNVDKYSIVNILSQKEIVKEFIQYGFTPKAVADYTLNLINHEEFAIEQHNKMIGVRKLLGGNGASKRAAQIIIKLAQQ